MYILCYCATFPSPLLTVFRVVDAGAYNVTSSFFPPPPLPHHTVDVEKTTSFFYIGQQLLTLVTILAVWDGALTIFRGLMETHNPGRRGTKSKLCKY
jgi:hypothetical protein